MKYLIIGASGFLGGVLYKKLVQAGKETAGTYSHEKRRGEFLYLNVPDHQRMLEIYREQKPDVMIWTVMDPEREEEIAVRCIGPLMKELHKTRFIFLSTSVAYEKNMPESIEPLIRTPDMYHYRYFNGKIKAESYIRTYDNYVIVRPGSIYGTDAYGNYDKRTQTLYRHIQNRENYYRAENICFSIVEVNDLADAIIELSEKEYTGILNISEEGAISHYDFNLALCRKYGWETDWVIPCRQAENIYFFDNTLRKRILKTKLRPLLDQGGKENEK